MKFVGIEAGAASPRPWSRPTTPAAWSRCRATPARHRSPEGFSEFHLGVDFFFVLSGFLMAWIHWGDIGQPGRVGRYAMRRATRIYPPYWVVSIVLITAYFLGLSTTFTASPEPGRILTSMLLLPSSSPPFLGVAWTLVFEMFFYVVFGLVIVIGRLGLYGLLVWAAAIVAYQVVPRDGVFPISFVLSAYNLEFLCGVLTAIALRHIRVPAPRIVASIGALLFLSFMIGGVGVRLEEYDILVRLAFGISAALFIVGMIETERTRPISIPAWLELLGAASYSIYLVHIIAEPASLVVLWRYAGSLRPELLTLILMAIGIGAGIVFHLAVEKPLMAWVQRLLRRQKTVPA